MARDARQAIDELRHIRQGNTATSQVTLGDYLPHLDGARMGVSTTTGPHTYAAQVRDIHPPRYETPTITGINRERSGTS